ncbi:MAG: SGNH/GDSL hydrolase family protein [Chitinispirillaceae bacterium]|nr:SGNH/GDSL hydrolase family protein [Chitinispirillaceae bacterium]
MAFVLLCTNNNPQTVQLPDLLITTRSDSTVSVRDSFYIHITIEGEEGIPVTYNLARDDSWDIATATAPGFSIAWNFPDTGTHQCIIWATDSTGRRSNNDTITVRVCSHSPEASLGNDTSTFVNEPLLLRCDATDRDGTIAWYEWSIDGGTFKRSTENGEDSLFWTWERPDTGCHRVTVVAVDNDGLSSEPDTQEVCILLEEPDFTLSGDTAVSVNDTVCFICQVTGTATTVDIYQWSTDPGGNRWFSTPGDTLELFWLLPDTGLQTVRCRITDSRGIVSAAESLLVQVSATYPEAIVHGPQKAYEGDTVSVTASAGDEDGTVVRLYWHISIPDSTFETGPEDTTITLFWETNDTGSCRIAVTAVDNDSLRSSAAVCSVQIVSASPVLEPVSDTTLTTADTLFVCRSLVDSGITADLFYFDFDGSDGWDDSSATAACTLTYAGATPVSLVTGVRSEKGRFFRDTVTVHFNRSPVIDSFSLVDNDTVWCGAAAVPGSLTVSVIVSDPDDDPFQATLIWSNESISDTISCSTAVRVPVAATGWYDWTLTGEDDMGNATSRNGRTCIGREYTICFAGHSIVAGLINDPDNPSTEGGFRAGVLAGLRDSLSDYERLRPVGPYITGNMSADISHDDSCFAVSGSVAREMYLLLEQAYPELNTDIWILMFGVNGSFSGPETSATHAFIRAIFTRNRNARLYVLTSPPYTENLSAIQFLTYNRTLRDSISNWAANGYAGCIVEADSVLSDGYTVYDSLFSNDVVHPNQAGYDAVRDEILEVMWGSAPPVFTVRREEQ